MEVTVTVLCLCILLFVCYKYHKPRRKIKLPPGPPGIPLFGNVLQFGTTKMMLNMSNAGDPYGEAYTVKLFLEKALVLNSFELIKETLCSQKYGNVFSGRPQNFVGSFVSPSDEMFSTYSEDWVTLRKIVMRGLRTYGTHLKDVEDLVQGELEHLVARLRAEGGKPVNPIVYISGYITSVLSMLITGRHLKHDDDQLKLISKITEEIIYFLHPGIAELMNLLPWLRHIPFGVGRVHQDLQRHVSILWKSINEDRLKAGSDRRYCFLDYVLEEEEEGHIRENGVKGTMLNLLFGGTGTSTTSLNSMFLVLAARPEIQKMIQAEVDEIIGRDRLPTDGDKTSMHYTQAFIWETFRHYTAVPMPIPRYTMADVQLREFFLPKDTMVFYNIWKINHEETFWKDPWVFDPARFLDNDGHLVTPDDEKRQRVLTFGIGKRLCIGEVLARLRIFLALTVVLQNFTILPDPAEPLPDLDPRTHDFSGLLMAPPYKVVFQQR